MKKLIASVLMYITLAGCAGTTVGDGVFDAREQAWFKAGVGVAVSAKPETAAPLYLLTEVSLRTMNVDLSDALSFVSVDDSIRPSVVDLVDIIEADMNTIIVANESTDRSKRLEIIRQMLTIVQNSAKERL